MHSAKLLVVILLMLLLLLNSCSTVSRVESEPDERPIEVIIEKLKSDVHENRLSYDVPRGARIEDVIIDDLMKTITITTNKRFAFRYLRELDVALLYAELHGYFGNEYEDYFITVESNGEPVENLVPNFYRNFLEPDSSRMPVPLKEKPLQVVRNISKPFTPTKGLNDRNIALWHSHGWYYNHYMDRWLWQRARLFQTVEDLSPMAYTIPFLIPMLENAGANVFVPRERDLQVNEVVIDNDVHTGTPYYLETSGGYPWNTGINYGFNYGEPPYPANFNPFLDGTYREVNSDTSGSSSVQYIPDIPEEGEYGVYVSYNSNYSSVGDAHYTVHHSGGSTDYLINQKIGGGTWIYLGSFHFRKGVNADSGKVVLTNKSVEAGKSVTTDAVRFGGGMGIVSRNGRTSGMPKFAEGSRYWLQYAGMPDTLVYNINGDTLDYTDDYQSRGEWVNYLVGAPFGPNKDRYVKGLGIPIDLSLAFHTDAGITKNDTTIGTLSIYSILDLDSNIVFPDGVSRLANRDLADILQTQIVDDLTYKYDPVWNRRYLWDGMYSEAARPNVPAVLLELLSHQNFIDVRFQSDPRFRFDASRSIYKAFLKFIAYQNGYDYVVQPLPVTHFSTRFNDTGDIELNWRPQADSLEESAIPTKYMVYKRIAQNGFDNGTLIHDTSYTFTEVIPGVIYSFKVTAVNEGGESFPSEILSVSRSENGSAPLMIVNCFDRISAPAAIETDKFSGFLNFSDAGVPYIKDIGFTGIQHNFNPDSKWQTDDTPGHGSSYADFETTVIPGNTFDYPYIHGWAILKNGYSFVSASDESVADSLVDLADYEIVDLICGEEKETGWTKTHTDKLLGRQFKIFTEEFKSAINKYLASGGNIFISGSYIGTDMFLGKYEKHPDALYARDTLMYKLDADHAVRNGSVYSIDENFLPRDTTIKFNTSLTEQIYAAEAPDAIGAVNGSRTLLRYSENRFSAGIGYNGQYGIVALGFPFETILSVNDRIILMRAVLNYLNN